MSLVWLSDVATVPLTETAEELQQGVFEAEASKLRAQALKYHAGLCVPPGQASVVRQYSELTNQPYKFAVCDAGSRAVAIVTVLMVWVGGGLGREPAAHLLLTLPAAGQASLCATQLATAYVAGPTAYSESLAGRVSFCAWVAGAIYLVAAPVVLRVLPYNSFVAQWAGCLLFAAASVPAVHASALPPFLRSNAGLPRLRVNQHVYFQAVVRALRILDCATGACPLLSTQEWCVEYVIGWKAALKANRCHDEDYI